LELGVGAEIEITILISIPANVLISKDMVAKISDFGLAKPVDDGESLTSGVGHTDFMAPEVSSLNNYNAPADIWSFGILPCHILYNSSGVNPRPEGVNTTDQAQYVNLPPPSTPLNLSSPFLLPSLSFLLFLTCSLQDDLWK
jgi:serine/threonine protein kinase